VTPPVGLPRAGDAVATAAFVARHGGRVVAYLGEVTTPERALRGAGEAFAALRVRLASPDPSDDAVGRALLSATRAAASRHGGRGLPTGDAPDAVARLLAARHAGRLDPDDDARLDALLLASPAARELAARYDRAERGYAGDRQAPLSDTEVDAIATAMALAVIPAEPGAAARRTAIPAPPAPPAVDLAAADDAETSAPPAPSAGAVAAAGRASRGVLESQVVRQLGVPALLLLAVVVVALVAAGAFSGQRDERVPPVPRPAIPTVPDDPRAIPPLP
jgi:hypothetical protein